MGLISIVWGLFALLWMLVALVPLLGWGNWFLIPFAAVGVVIGAFGIVLSPGGHAGRAKAGLVINALVILVAIVRLHLGGGVL